MSQLLEPIAAWFRDLGIPEPIIHWGHPLMMTIVVFVMGSVVIFTGWQGRISQDKNKAIKSCIDHRRLAPWMFLFIALGYIGGVLSLVIQRQSIFHSGHFWTGSIVVLLLLISSITSLTGFGGNKLILRAIHAYLGTTAFCLLLLHTFLGWKLGMAID